MALTASKVISPPVAVTGSDYTKPERIQLRTHPDLGEKWVQERIEEDTSILGLGELDFLRSEKIQPHAGRLDLLLQDSETMRRYEVEIQLGATDPPHIIRTIEYWDIERKRYPQYDHCAVLVAEDITSRFLNILALFNGSIPFIAIQMQALRVASKLTLVFTTVVNELTRGPDDEEQDPEATPTDRNYWEQKRATKETVTIADEVLELARKLDSELSLKYNKVYIGFSHSGQPFNFMTVKPKKKFTALNTRIDRSDEIDRMIDQGGSDALEYDKSWRKYRLKLYPGDLRKHQEIIETLIRIAYDNYSN